MKKYYTRKELVDALRERGIPMSKSKFNKLAAPSAGRGPPVAAWYGPISLYELEPGIEWGESLLCPEPSSLQPSQESAAASQRAEQSAPLTRKPQPGGPSDHERPTAAK
jgi:hypothetical protein